MKKIQQLLVTEGSTQEEKAIVLNMRRLEDVVITIADKEDPRQKGTYKYVSETQQFMEQTGVSNYLQLLTVEEFAEALKDFDYQVTVSAA